MNVNDIKNKLYQLVQTYNLDLSSIFKNRNVFILKDLDNQIKTLCISANTIIDLLYDDTINEWKKTYTSDELSVFIDNQLSSKFLLSDIGLLYINDDLTHTLLIPSLTYYNTGSYNGTYNLSMLTEFTESCFEYSKLENIIIPSNIQTFSRASFRNMNNLVNVSINKKCNTIESKCFYNDYNLISIDLINTSISSLGYSVFENCQSLHTVQLSPTLQCIGTSAFKNCINMSSINLEDTNISSLNWETFYNCSSLTSISLPSSLIQVDIAAFTNCNNLSIIDCTRCNTCLTSLQSSYIEENQININCKIIISDSFYDNWISIINDKCIIKESDFKNKCIL